MPTPENLFRKKLENFCILLSNKDLTIHYILISAPLFAWKSGPNWSLNRYYLPN